MALLEAPSQLNDDLKPGSIPPPPGTPDEIAAVQLVVKNLNRAEYYLLAKGMTVEWDKDDRLYLFRMPQAFWEGSSVPRSSLGMPLCLEHIEATMRQVMPVLFPDDTSSFVCDPMPSTSRKAADASKIIIASQLKKCGMREETRLGVKSGLTYGTAVHKNYWKRSSRVKRTWKWKEAPEITQTDVGTIQTPTKKSKEAVEDIETVVTDGPWTENVYIRHVIVSPDLRVPDVRKANYVIHRTYPTMEEIDDLRLLPGFKIPPYEDLVQLMMPPKETPERSLLEGRSTSSVLNTGISSLDINMEFRAMPRWQEASADPNQGKLELLEYWTPERVIYVLNRKLCLKNDINPFGKIPFLSFCYIDVLDSFYGIGICKLVGGEQRLQQGVINSRLDDLALRLSGTFLRKRGANTPTQQLRLRPGGIIDSDDEKGVQMIEYPPAIVDAFTEVEASDQRAQRRTSANSAVTQGTPGPQGQIGRTATGMDTVAAAVGTAMGYFVDFICDLYLIPLIENFHEMNCQWLEPEQIEAILGEELGEDYSEALNEGLSDEKDKSVRLDALDVKNACLKFNIQAGTRLRAKQAMAQQLMTIIQLLQQASVQDSLDAQGKKTDWAKLVDAMWDMGDWPGTQDWIVDQTDQDKQRAAAKAQAQQQMGVDAQKHAHRMGEIEQKGVASIVTKIVDSLLQELSPEGRMQLLQLNQAAMDAATQQNNQSQSGQPQSGPSQNGGNGNGGDGANGNGGDGGQ
jgi:hypothetical protein